EAPGFFSQLGRVTTLGGGWAGGSPTKGGSVVMVGGPDPLMSLGSTLGSTNGGTSGCVGIGVRCGWTGLDCCGRGGGGSFGGGGGGSGFHGSITRGGGSLRSTVIGVTYFW